MSRVPRCGPRTPPRNAVYSERVDSWIADELREVINALEYQVGHST